MKSAWPKARWNWLLSCPPGHELQHGHNLPSVGVGQHGPIHEGALNAVDPLDDLLILLLSGCGGVKISFHGPSPS